MNKLFQLMLVVNLLYGCTAAPIRIDQIDVSTKKSIEVPVDAHLIIDMRIEDREKTLIVKQAWNSWTFNEGEIIESAALKVFGKVFSEADTSIDTSTGHLFARVDGDGHVDVFWGTYKVNASLYLTDKNGDKIARYQANGKSASGMVNDTTALENAYVNAYTDIANQILDDDKFISQVKNGFGDELHASTYGGAAVDSSSTSQAGSSGSGFFINEYGYALTNNHVIDGCDKLTTKIDGNEVALILIAQDKTNDLAVVKISGASPSYGKFRGGRGLRPGDDVVAVGFPLKGLLSSNATTTFGSINNLSGIGNDSRLVQVSTPVQQGNSGGPLLDSSGNISGVIVSKLNAITIAQITGDIPQNINFAINSSIARAFLDSNGVDYYVDTSDRKSERTAIAEKGINFTIPISCK